MRLPLCYPIESRDGNVTLTRVTFTDSSTPAEPRARTWRDIPPSPPLGVPLPPPSAGQTDTHADAPAPKRSLRARIIAALVALAVPRVGAVGVVDQVLDLVTHPAPLGGHVQIIARGTDTPGTSTAPVELPPAPQNRSVRVSTSRRLDGSHRPAHACPESHRCPGPLRSRRAHRCESALRSDPRAR